MLNSIDVNNDDITLALSASEKYYLSLTQTELRRIREIIALLEGFKEHTDKLGSEKDVTISLIVPVFKYFETNILDINEHDSVIITQLKTHMLTKLKTRYSASQK